jgi:putative aldouronate transport system substrate-binding protein
VEKNIKMGVMGIKLPSPKRSYFMKKSLLLFFTVFLVMFTLSLVANGEKEVVSDMGNFNPTGYPIVNEPITLNAVVLKHPLNGDFYEMKGYQDLVELTNISLNMDVVAGSGWQEKKNLMLAANDLPDFFTGGNIISQSDQVRYGPQGLFLPLEDMIDSYGSNIQRVFEMRPLYKKGVTAPDGHIYSVPWAHELTFRENPENFFINNTWLDQLGIPVPTTTEELYRALKAFKDNDMNGNGDSTDEIPMSFVGDYSDHGIRSLFGSWGVIDRSNHMMLRGNKVIFTPTEKGYKEGVIYFNKLYNEGLLDPEGFTQNTAEFRAKGKSEDALYGVFLGWLDANEVGTQRANEDYLAIAPLKGPSGDKPLWLRDDNFLDRGHFVITNSNPYPEATLRWADACLDDERSLTLARGEFGINLQKNADGSIEFMPTPEGMSYGEFRFKNAPGDPFPWVLMSHWYDKITLVAAQDKKLKVHYPIYKPYLEERAYPTMYFLPEQEEQLATLTTDINSYVEKKRAEWITGSADINAEWDNYLNQLNKMGLKDLIKINQDAYDTYNKD